MYGALNAYNIFSVGADQKEWESSGHGQVVHILELKCFGDKDKGIMVPFMKRGPVSGIIHVFFDGEAKLCGSSVAYSTRTGQWLKVNSSLEGPTGQNTNCSKGGKVT